MGDDYYIAGHISKRFDLTGKRFGRLTVTSFYGSIRNKRYWNCTCSCGGSIVVARFNLKNGSTKSCGCKRREAGAIRGKANKGRKHDRRH